MALHEEGGDVAGYPSRQVALLAFFPVGPASVLWEDGVSEKKKKWNWRVRVKYDVDEKRYDPIAATGAGR